MGAEPGETADSRAEETESKPSPEEGSSPESTSEGPDRSPESDSLGAQLGGVKSSSVQRSASAGTAGGGRARTGSASNGTVDFDSGPNHAAMSERYGLSVRSGEGAKLQRLEKEFGSAKVQRWAEEGMTVDTMGKARDMKAFRKRQEDRPEEVPTDIERRNEASVHRNSDGGDSGPAGNAGAPDSVRNVVSSPGKSMDDSVQGEMESKMGGDFSDVQLHTGPKAAAAADSINARAFTVGNHVAFNKGEYQPGTDSGKEVLAHELTHVRQQTNGAVSMLPAEDAQLEIDPDPKLEKEAQETAERVTSDDSRTVRRMGTEMHVQLLPENSKAFTGESPAAVQRAEGESSVAVQRAEGEGSGEKSGTKYVVSEGDTLSQIASEHGISDWRKLWEHNKDVVGQDPHLIRPGQELTIPESEDAAPEPTMSEPEGKFCPAVEPSPKQDNYRTSQQPEAPGGGQSKISPDAGASGSPPKPEEKEPDPPDVGDGGGSGGPTGGGAGGGVPQTNVDPGQSVDPGSVPDPQKAVESAPTDGAPTTPENDPGFQETKRQIEQGTEAEKVTPPASGLTENAQEAVSEPPEETKGRAEAEQTAAIEVKEPEPFDKEGFKQNLEQRLEKATPDSLEEAENAGDNKELDNLSEDVKKKAEKEKKTTQEKDEKLAKEGPDAHKKTPKKPKKLQKPDPGSKPQVDEQMTEGAVPKKKTKAEVEGRVKNKQAKLDQKWEKESMNEEAMQNSTVPKFSKAAETKQQSEKRSEELPGEIREVEKGARSQAKTEMQSKMQSGVQDIHGERQSKLNQAGQKQEENVTADEQKRKEIHTKIDEIYKNTETKVQTELDEMDEKIQKLVGDDGLFADIKENFEEDWDELMSQYKEERYSGLSGAWNWVKDSFSGAPDDLEQEFEKRRDQFFNEVQTKVIDKTANIVEEHMNNVKQHINKGRKQMQSYIEKQPEHLQKIAARKAQEINQKFTQLEQKAESRKNQMVNDVVASYEETVEHVDKQLESKMEEWESTVFSAAIDWAVGTWETLTKLWDMLQKILKKAASAATQVRNRIMSDGWEVLEDVGNVVTAGFEGFLANIGDHLINGVIEYLTGGIELDFEMPELPSSISDWTGILKFMGDIALNALNLGFEYMMQRAEKTGKWAKDVTIKGTTKPLSEWVQLAVDAGKDIWGILQEVAGIGLNIWEEGFGALLNIDQLSGMIDLQGQLFGIVKDQLMSIISGTVIEAGIEWVASLLSPVSAIVKAVKAIVDFVDMVITRAAQFKAFIDGILDGVISTMAGKVSQGASLVEGVLADLVPLALGGITSLIGVGDSVVEGVSGIIQKGMETLNNWVDSLLESTKGYAESAVETVAPAFVSMGLIETEEDEEADDEGKGGKRRRSGGKAKSAAAGAASSARSGSGKSSGGKSGTGKSSGSSEDEEKGWKEKVEESAGKVESKVSDYNEKVDGAIEDKTGISSDASPDDIIDRANMEDQRVAVDLTVKAEEEGLAASEADYVLRTTELTSAAEESDLTKAEFVKAHAGRMRSALVEAVVDTLQSIGEIEDWEHAGDVWDEGKKEWVDEYMTQLGEMAGSMAATAAEKATSGGEEDGGGEKGGKGSGSEGGSGGGKQEKSGKEMAKKLESGDKYWDQFSPEERKRMWNHLSEKEKQRLRGGMRLAGELQMGERSWKQFGEKEKQKMWKHLPKEEKHRVHNEYGPPTQLSDDEERLVKNILSSDGEITDSEAGLLAAKLDVPPPESNSWTKEGWEEWKREVNKASDRMDMFEDSEELQIDHIYSGEAANADPIYSGLKDRYDNFQEMHEEASIVFEFTTPKGKTEHRLRSHEGRPGTSGSTPTGRWLTPPHEDYDGIDPNNADKIKDLTGKELKEDKFALPNAEPGYISKIEIPPDTPMRISSIKKNFGEPKGEWAQSEILYQEDISGSTWKRMYTLKDNEDEELFESTTPEELEQLRKESGSSWLSILPW